MNFQNLEDDHVLMNLQKSKRHSLLSFPKKIQTSMLMTFILIILVAIAILYLFITLISKSYEINALEGQLESITREHHIKKEEKESMLLEIDTLNKKNQGISDNIIQAKEQITSLNKELEKASYASDSSMESYENVFFQYTDGKQKIEKLKLLNEQKRQNIPILDEEIKKVNNKINNMKENISQLKKKYKELTGKEYDISIPDDKDTGSLVNNSKILSKAEFAYLNTIIYPEGLDFNLVYRASRDGLIAENFHSLCGQKKQFNTLTIIQTTKNDVFGGYTFGSWGMSGFREDKNAFLFNVKTQKKFKVRDSAHACFTGEKLLTVFGNGDLVIGENKSHSSFPISYEGDIPFELTNGEENFEVKEMEVFVLSKTATE